MRRYSITDRGWEFFEDDSRLVFITWLAWGDEIKDTCAMYGVHSAEELALVIAEREG
jgi:hypothetical protein